MRTLLSLCLLLALLSPVASLRCKTCFGCGETCRDEDVRTEECEPDQDVCLAVSTNFTILQFPFGFTYKGCSRSNECIEGYYIGGAVDGRYGQEKTLCCQTDECNERDLHLPNYNNLKPNGLKCPRCFSRNSDYCDTQGKTIQCRGTENQCIDMTFDMSPYGLPSQRITMQGCANKELCFYPMGKSSIGNGLIQIDFFSKYCQSVQGSSKQPETKG